MRGYPLEKEPKCYLKCENLVQSMKSLIENFLELWRIFLPHDLVRL